MDCCAVKKLHILVDAIWRIYVEIFFLEKALQHRSICKIHAVDWARERERECVKNARHYGLGRYVNLHFLTQNVWVTAKSVSEPHDLLCVRSHFKPEIICLDRVMIRKAVVLAFKDEDVVTPAENNVVLILFSIALDLECLRLETFLFQK